MKEDISDLRQIKDRGEEETGSLVTVVSPLQTASDVPQVKALCYLQFRLLTERSSSESSATRTDSACKSLM